MDTTKTSQFEEFVYAAKYNIWISSKELPHVHELVLNAKNHTKYIPPKATSTMKTGVGGRTDNKEQQPTNETRVAVQKDLRDKIKELFNDNPRNSFFYNLKNWKWDYTTKQGACIIRAYDELKGRKDKNKNFDTTPDSITEEERNDPNWTPWD